MKLNQFVTDSDSELATKETINTEIRRTTIVLEHSNCIKEQNNIEEPKLKREPNESIFMQVLKAIIPECMLYLDRKSSFLTTARGYFGRHHSLFVINTLQNLERNLGRYDTICTK